MLAPRFKGRYFFLNASHGLASHSTSAPQRLLVYVTGDERNRALQVLFANCVTSGGGGRHPQELQITYNEDSPKWNKFLNSHYLTSLRDRRPPLTGYREKAAVSVSHRFPGRFPASQARAAPQTPESRAEKTAGLPRVPSSEGVRGGAGASGI